MLYKRERKESQSENRCDGWWSYAEQIKRNLAKLEWVNDFLTCEIWRQTKNQCIKFDANECSFIEKSNHAKQINQMSWLMRISRWELPIRFPSKFRIEFGYGYRIYCGCCSFGISHFPSKSWSYMLFCLLNTIFQFTAHWWLTWCNLSIVHLMFVRIFSVPIDDCRWELGNRISSQRSARARMPYRYCLKYYYFNH